jgi:hypothetical protein
MAKKASLVYKIGQLGIKKLCGAVFVRNFEGWGEEQNISY